MVGVKDRSFPGLIVVVVREAFVALSDEPVGTHLQAGRGEIRPASVSLGLLLCVCWGQGPCVLVLSLGVWVQDPWKHACIQACVHPSNPPPPQPSSFAEQAQGYPRAVSPHPQAPEAGPHLVTELEGSEQQKGPRGGPVYSPVGSVQSLRPQESVREPSPPAVKRLARMRGTRPLPRASCSHLFFMYRSRSGCSNRYLSSCKASWKASWGLRLWAGMGPSFSYLSGGGPKRDRGRDWSPISR